MAPLLERTEDPGAALLPVRLLPLFSRYASGLEKVFVVGDCEDDMAVVMQRRSRLSCTLCSKRRKPCIHINSVISCTNVDAPVKA